ncbi:MAG: hypothetical protein R2711_01285 [Acidimicrobiales bacterium]
MGKWAHDAPLLAMLGLLALSDLTVAEGRPKPPAAIAGVVAAAAVAAHPRSTDAAQAVAGGLAAAAEVRRFVRQGGPREVFVALPCGRPGSPSTCWGAPASRGAGPTPRSRPTPRGTSCRLPPSGRVGASDAPAGGGPVVPPQGVISLASAPGRRGGAEAFGRVAGCSPGGRSASG